MSRYTKGADFERSVLSFLADDDHLAGRLAGSKSKYFGEVVDIIAFHIPTSRWLLIQAKIDGIISSSDKEKLIAVAHQCGATPVLAYKSGSKVELKYL